MSMAERAAAFNQLFDQEMGRHELGKLYRGMGISKQKMQSRPGPPIPSEKALT